MIIPMPIDISNGCDCGPMTDDERKIIIYAVLIFVIALLPVIIMATTMWFEMWGDIISNIIDFFKKNKN